MAKPILSAFADEYAKSLTEQLEGLNRFGIKYLELRQADGKNVANMFIVGEMLNVDGDCGGYNLTFAFVSGITCAKKIKRLNEEQK